MQNTIQEKVVKHEIRFYNEITAEDAKYNSRKGR